MNDVCDACSGKRQNASDSFLFRRSLLALYYYGVNALDSSVAVPSCKEIEQTIKDDIKLNQALLDLTCAVKAIIDANGGLGPPEEDPVFTAWLNQPPNISIFNNDVGYITSATGTEVDPVFNTWLATNPLDGYVPYVGAIANVNLGWWNLTANMVTAGIPNFTAFYSRGHIDLLADQRLVFDAA